jgi:ABC-type amino acid transport substrate-binding protein
MNGVRMDSQQESGSPFASKRYGYIAIGIILGLCLFYLFQSCTLNTVVEPRYNIGQDIRWLGLHLMGKERNVSAFNTELLAAIAKHQHFRVHLTASSDPLSELEQGKLQGVLTSLQPTYLNENRLLFSAPFFRTGPVLITPSAPKDQTWNEKRKNIIGIQNNSPLLSGIEQDPTIQIRLYDDILPALADLRERRIDGAIFPAIPAYTYTQTFYKNELKITTLPLNDEGIRLVTLKNERGESLMKQFAEGIEVLKQNGTFSEMLERWGFINVEQLDIKSFH